MKREEIYANSRFLSPALKFITEDIVLCREKHKKVKKQDEDGYNVIFGRKLENPKGSYIIQYTIPYTV